jgi:hypothetical protein
MVTFIRWSRVLLAALALALWPPPIVASGLTTTQSQATASARTTSAASETRERIPAGSPELGVLIIIGLVGFLVLVAWIFARVGDDSRRGPSDRTLL